ncbi:hypothetical protein E4659_11670 [Dickeya dianthicola]|uniref:hypothetical protein n=1 Tax=Dickeya dianthicola TaxID=204039 RepID=UPI0003A45B80|nr:hypothetical protein [Dickeya dianthicola]ATO33159.1 hypothetical protein DDI_1991 [Dickeya dianthicola RNS04.9]MBI0466408.1 hypothetical protein [Dickeya dianthicola]MCI4232538.1 hypothetical protein [Dickeya dianthicola]MZG44453.1 hypothetical protein [Dickeya dianthicola]MZI00373.1 hypothetical protein [Dickeya dianthicola]
MLKSTVDAKNTVDAKKGTQATPLFFSTIMMTTLLFPQRKTEWPFFQGYRVAVIYWVCSETH